MRNILLITACFLISTVAVCAQTGGLKGTVRNPKNAAIVGATVTVRQDGKDLKTATTDRKGNFEIRNLAAGKYNLVFEGEGYGSALLADVEVKKDKIRELPDKLVLTVDQGTLIIIKGSVFNQDGRSVTGAVIVCEKVNEDGSFSKVGNSYTSITGEFTFRQPVGAKHYRLTAKLKDATASKEIEVESAAIYRLAITLELTK